MMKRQPFTNHGNVARPSATDGGAWYAFTCGYCGSHTAGAVVARYNPVAGFEVLWLACTSCSNGSVKDPDGGIHPAGRFGPQIEGLPSDVAAAYEEARASISVSALTACELICRKILMHVAVEKGAKEGESFASYVDHLEQAGYVTPPMKPWIEEIRRIGNAATHRLEAPNKTRAESALMFTAELLRLVYEMELMTKRYVPQKP